MADIKGQKVVTGLMPTTSTSLFIKLLKENGMDANKDVDMIQVQTGSEAGPFLGELRPRWRCCTNPAWTRSRPRA